MVRRNMLALATLAISSTSLEQTAEKSAYFMMGHFRAKIASQCLDKGWQQVCITS